jgi:hypothetical protein
LGEVAVFDDFANLGGQGRLNLRAPRKTPDHVRFW